MIIKKSLQGRGVKNFFWSVFEVIVFPLVLILATPFFLRELGEEKYGIWMLLNSLLAFLDILGFGVNESLIKYISQFTAQRRETSRINLIVNNALILLLAVLLGVGVALWASIYHPFETLLKEHASDSSLIYDLILIAFIGLFLKMVEMFALSIIRGFDRYDIAARLSLATKLLIIFFNFLVIWNGYGLQEVFYSIIVAVLIMLIVEFFYLKNYFPTINLKLAFTKDVFIEVRSFMSWSWIQTVFNTIAVHIDKLIVASLAGVSVLAYYSLGFLVYKQLVMLMKSGSNWLFPRISALDAKGSSLVRLFENLLLILNLFSLLVAVFLYLGKDYLLQLWLGETAALRSEDFIVLFSILACIHGTIYSINLFFYGSGKNLKLSTIIDFVFKLISVIAIFIGYEMFGVKGIIAGQVIVSIIFLPILCASVIKYHIHDIQKKWKFIFSSIIFLPVVVLFTTSNKFLIYLCFFIIFLIIGWFAYLLKKYNRGYISAKIAEHGGE